MFKEYFQLREVGHDRRESLIRAFGYSVINPIIDFIGPFFIATHADDAEEILPEVQAEQDLTSLEARIDTLDFQSLSDLANLSANIKPKRYTTAEEGALVYLHRYYVSTSYTGKPFLSPEQTKRYEAILERLPQKFDEFLSAIEQGAEELTGYQKRKREVFQQKEKDWEDHHNSSKTI